MAGERIQLEGLPNTRDLGGYRTTDGKVLRAKRIIRSGALAAATENDIRILTEEYHLKTVVDFRTDIEKKQKPDPVIQGVDNIDNAILEEKQMGITHEDENRPEDIADDMIARCREMGDTAGDYLEKLYPVLVTHEFSIGRYRRFFELLLEQEEGALLYHCSEGKDRVGTATALLLSALGVERKTVIEDYLLTNRYTEAKRQKMLAMIQKKLPGETKLHERFVLLNSVRESYLLSIFDTIDRKYGSMENFLTEQMELTQEKRNRLREMYLQ